MEREFELEVMIPPNIRELEIGGRNISNDRDGEGSCEKCPVAKTLSGEALKTLLKNCTGLKFINMGCDSVLKCQSPDKETALTQNVM